MDPARRAHLWAFGIACAYALLAGLQSYATRLGWGPDEPAHLIYVQSLALDGRIPRLDGGREHYRPGASISHQAQHPPAYYALAAVAYRLLPIRSDTQAYRLLRFVSIALGLIALWLHWRLVTTVFDAAIQQIAAFACLAFLPMFTYITSVVNNDSLAIVAFAGAMQALARHLAGKAGRFGPAAIGLWMALGFAAKESAMALIPVAVTALLLPRPDRDAKRRMADAALAVAIAALPALAWYGRNTFVHGTPFVYAYVQPAFPNMGAALAYPRAALLMLALTALHTFTFLYAPWWAIAKQVPGPLYFLPLMLVSAIALVGLVSLFISYRRGRQPVSACQARTLALFALLVALVFVGIWRYVLFVDLRALQGSRYMIVVWPALAVLGVAGLSALLPRRRNWGLAALVLLWLAADLVCIWAVGREYGAW